ncbi:MAG: LCP family protein [Lachnospiraceae bacterium]
MMTMMNKNLDLNIVDYVTVDFKGVAEAVELLGGIDVDLKEEEIEHLNNYCVETSEVTGMDYTPLKKVAGVHHLNGVRL